MGTWPAVVPPVSGLDDPDRLRIVRGVSSDALHEPFDRLARLAAKATGAPFALVSLVHADRQVLAGAFGLPELMGPDRATPLSHSFCKHVVRDRAAFTVEDARKHPKVHSNLLVQAGVRSYAGVPLELDGHVLGAVSVLDMVPRRWDEGDMAALVDLAAGARTELRLQRALPEVESGRLRLAEAQAVAGMGSWEWDVRRDEAVWSDELHRIYDLPRGTLSPALAVVLERVHPEDRERVEQALRLSVKELRPFSIEARIVRPDGDVRTIQASGRVLVGEDGRPERMVGVQHDVTDSRRSNQALVEATQRFARAFHDAPIGMAVLDLDGRCLQVNEALCQMLGYDEQDMIGQRWSDVAHPDDGLVGDHWAERALAGESDDLAREGRLLRKDGRILTASMKASLVRDGEGRPLYYIGQWVDTTEQRRTERQLAALLRSMGEGVFAFDSEGRVTFANAAATRILGHGRQALLGHPLAARIGLRAENGSASYPLQLVCETGRTVQVDDAVATRADGTEIAVAYTVSPLPLEEGVGGVMTFRDTTGERARARSLEAEAEALARIDDIREAVEDEHLAVHAQPIVDLESGETVAEELLVRMVDRAGRSKLPAEFLQLAERFGMVERIDRWMIGQGAELAAAGRRVHVNLSACTLGTPELAAVVEAELVHHDADPSNLTFEVTETALMEDVDRCAAVAARLARLGCGLALDDFGTGFGGLNYVKRLPFSEIKIDIEFVRDLTTSERSRRVVEMVVGLAGALGLETVAEGVEEESTRGLLRELGVQRGQGWLFGRPKLVR